MEAGSGIHLTIMFIQRYGSVVTAAALCVIPWLSAPKTCCPPTMGSTFGPHFPPSRRDLRCYASLAVNLAVLSSLLCLRCLKLLISQCALLPHFNRLSHGVQLPFALADVTIRTSSQVEATGKTRHKSSYGDQHNYSQKPLTLRWAGHVAHCPLKNPRASQ